MVTYYYIRDTKEALIRVSTSHNGHLKKQNLSHIKKVLVNCTDT